MPAVVLSNTDAFGVTPDDQIIGENEEAAYRLLRLLHVVFLGGMFLSTDERLCGQ